MASLTARVQSDLQGASDIRDFVRRRNRWARALSKAYAANDIEKTVELAKAITTVKWVDGDRGAHLNSADHSGWGPEGLITHKRNSVNIVEVTPWSRIRVTKRKHPHEIGYRWSVIS